MTRHLSDDVLADLAESGGSHPHLGECERCAAWLRDAREALAETRRPGVPEPSPLFWEHLSARVHAAVEDDARSAARSRRSVFVWVPAAAAVLIVCAAAVWLVQGDRQSESARSAAVHTPAAVAAPGPRSADVQAAAAEMLPPASDPTWGVLAHVAQSIQFEDTVLARPGATDRAIAHLSTEEQQEFMRLLKREMSAPPSQ